MTYHLIEIIICCVTALLCAGMITDTIDKMGKRK